MTHERYRTSGNRRTLVDPGTETQATLGVVFSGRLRVTGGILISITPTSTKKTVLNGRFLTTLPIPGRIVSSLRGGARDRQKNRGTKGKDRMQIPAMFKAVRTAANYSNIEGVVIGSCSVGNNIDDFLSTTKNSRISWIFGTPGDRLDGLDTYRCLAL